MLQQIVLKDTTFPKHNKKIRIIFHLWVHVSLISYLLHGKVQDNPELQQETNTTQPYVVQSKKYNSIKRLLLWEHHWESRVTLRNSYASQSAKALSATYAREWKISNDNSKSICLYLDLIRSKLHLIAPRRNIFYYCFICISFLLLFLVLFCFFSWCWGGNVSPKIFVLCSCSASFHENPFLAIFLNLLLTVSCSLPFCFSSRFCSLFHSLLVLLSGSGYWHRAIRLKQFLIAFIPQTCFEICPCFCLLFQSFQL